MARTPFQVEVLTPEGEAFNDEVEMVSTRTPVGSIGILANHQPLLGMLHFCRGHIRPERPTKTDCARRASSCPSIWSGRIVTRSMFGPVAVTRPPSALTRQPAGISIVNPAGS